MILSLKKNKILIGEILYNILIQPPILKISEAIYLIFCTLECLFKVQVQIRVKTYSNNIKKCNSLIFLLYPHAMAMMFIMVCSWLNLTFITNFIKFVMPIIVTKDNPWYTLVAKLVTIFHFFYEVACALFFI